VIIKIKQKARLPNDARVRVKASLNSCVIIPNAAETMKNRKAMKQAFENNRSTLTLMTAPHVEKLPPPL